MPNPTLIYSFAPWGKNHTNISEEVLKRIDLPVDKLILKIRFNSQTFRDIVHQGHSQIIGLGQYPSGQNINYKIVANSGVQSGANVARI